MTEAMPVCRECFAGPALQEMRIRPLGGTYYEAAALLPDTDMTDADLVELWCPRCALEANQGTTIVLGVTQGGKLVQREAVPA